MFNKFNNPFTKDNYDFMIDNYELDDYLIMFTGSDFADWVYYCFLFKFWFCKFLYFYIPYKLQRRGIDFNLLRTDFILRKEDYFLFRRIGMNAYWDFRQARAKRESMIEQNLLWRQRKVAFLKLLNSIPLFFKLCYLIFLKIKEKIRVNSIIFWTYFKKFCKNFSFICYKIYCYSTVFAFPYVFPKMVALEICSLLTQQYFCVKMYYIKYYFKAYLKYFYTQVKIFFLSFKFINFIINTKAFIYICKFFKNIYHKILVKLGLRKKTIKIKIWVKKKKKEDK